MTTELEQELTQACGLKISKGGDRQAYLLKLVKAVNELDDKTWNKKLSTAAQNWQNAAIEAHTQEQDIPDFTGDDAEAAAEEEAEEAEEVIEEEEEEEVAAPAAPVKAKKETPVAKTVKRTDSNGKDKAVKETRTKLVAKPITKPMTKAAKSLRLVPATKATKPDKSGVPANLVIRDMVLKNVNVTNKELAAALLKKGRGEVSTSVISGIAYTFREMLRATEKAGLLKRPLPPRPPRLLSSRQ